MAHYCYHCGTELILSDTVGRKEECQACGYDLHCCYNCKFYDKTAYNECKEPQAERTLDKDKANFCDYFTMSQGKAGTKGDDKSAAKKALDDLFK
ncbi:MAG: hypothetical protein H6619_04915 [Deltaproteobacteria bacterium]|nr:hypothetical protein [Deltaproteobacteria bacterium]